MQQIQAQQQQAQQLALAAQTGAVDPMVAQQQMQAAEAGGKVAPLVKELNRE